LGFVQQYRRKAQPSTEPNDRQDRKMEERLKRLPPEDFEDYYPGRTITTRSEVPPDNAFKLLVLRGAA